MDSRCQNIAQRAKSKGMWLYDPQYKKWYSPEDFLQIFGHYAAADDFFYNRLQIRHPNEGIQAGFKKLTDLNTRLQNFTNYVMNYYKKK
jgi:hypothetical protein